MSRKAYWYHITPTRNVRGILSRGLIPQTRPEDWSGGRYSMFYPPREKPVLYVAASPLLAEHWAEYQEDLDIEGFTEPMTMLRFTMPSGVQLWDDPEASWILDDESPQGSWIITEPIPPENISVVYHRGPGPARQPKRPFRPYLEEED